MPSTTDTAAETIADVARLRRDRLERAFAAMERHGLDALVLGREGNVRFVSDARRLWLAGPRPFGPGCVVVRATRQVHLLATSRAGVPETIPDANLYALTWNPDRLAARLARIEGLATARTIGVDGWSPAAGRLLARVAPGALLADGDLALRAARAVKSADELACIRAAAAIASAGLAAMRAALAAAGGDPAEPALRAAFVARTAALGAPIPAFTTVVHPAVRGPLVALRAGVLCDGYEATLARTYAATAGGERGAEASALARRAARVRERLVAACRPGAAAHELLAAYAAAGEPLPSLPVAYGVGLGCEPPLVGRDHVCDDAWRVEAGMVLAVQALVAERDGSSCLTQDLVHVRDGAAEILTPEPCETFSGRAG